MRANLRSLLKNIRLVINRIHVRFEDDYLSNGESKQWEPFALGLVAERIELASAESRWANSEEGEFIKVKPPR